MHASTLIAMQRLIECSNAAAILSCSICLVAQMDGQCNLAAAFIDWLWTLCKFLQLAASAHSKNMPLNDQLPLCHCCLIAHKCHHLGQTACASTFWVPADSRCDHVACSPTTKRSCMRGSSLASCKSGSSPWRQAAGWCEHCTCPRRPRLPCQTCVPRPGCAKRSNSVLITTGCGCQLAIFRTAPVTRMPHAAASMRHAGSISWTSCQR